MTAPLPTAAQVAADTGRKIEAIKIQRELEGIDLKEAKDRVELYIDQHPELRERLEQANREMRGKLIKWALVIDALIAAGVLYWFFGR